MLLGQPAGISWPTAAFGLRGPSEGKGEAARQGVGPWPHWPSFGRGEATPTPRLHGGAARPATGGHLQPRQDEQASARDAREDDERGRVARRGWRREGRRLPWRPSTAAPWPSVARLGEAQPEFGRRHKRERDLREGEAELQARDCWSR